MLKSQQVRSLSPEMDPLRMGMGWTVDDLSKPQIMVESTYGNSHPGSGHLNIFVEEAVRGVNDHGGKAARYFATDMCDGMAQGHDGINYSLAHREAITNLVEAQANATAGIQQTPVLRVRRTGACGTSVRGTGVRACTRTTLIVRFTRIGQTIHGA